MAAVLAGALCAAGQGWAEIRTFNFTAANPVVAGPATATGLAAAVQSFATISGTISYDDSTSPFLSGPLQAAYHTGSVSLDQLDLSAFSLSPAIATNVFNGSPGVNVDTFSLGNGDPTQAGNQVEVFLEDDSGLSLTSSALPATLSLFPTMHVIQILTIGGVSPHSEAGFTYTLTSLTAAPASAPEPGAWALLVSGFGAAGALLRRRRRALA